MSPVKLLVDAQLPPALARWLSAQGLQASHVADHGLANASDDEIWQYACKEKRVIVTKDEDFALRRVLADSRHPAVVWLRLGNTRNQALLDWLGPLLGAVVSALEQGETLLEVF